MYVCSLVPLVLSLAQLAYGVAKKLLSLRLRSSLRPDAMMKTLDRRTLNEENRV